MSDVGGESANGLPGLPSHSLRRRVQGLNAVSRVYYVGMARGDPEGPLALPAQVEMDAAPPRS